MKSNLYSGINFAFIRINTTKPKLPFLRDYIILST